MQKHYATSNVDEGYFEPVTRTPEIFSWSKAQTGKATHYIRKPLDVIHAAMSKIKKLNYSLKRDVGYSVIFYDDAGKIKSSFATTGKIILDSLLIFMEVRKRQSLHCSVILFGRENLTPTAADMLLITCLFEPLKLCTGIILDDVMVLGESKYFSCVKNGTPIYAYN